jgi:ATP-dependent Lon protease
MAKLPVLLLAHPLILFPSAHITIPVSKTIGEALISLSTTSDAADEEPPTIAALPITSTDTTNIVAEDISLHGTGKV